MKKIIFITFILLFPKSYFATAPSKYWIQFTGKNDTAYTVENPRKYLSQKAIDRREKQHIPIVSSDLPVDSLYINTVLQTGVTIINKSKWFNAITIQTEDTNVVNTIKSFPFVRDAIPVGILRSVSTDLTSGVTYLKTAQTKQNENYGASFNQINMLAGTCLHNDGYRGRDMRIAVIDAGYTNVDFLPAFDSLRLNNKIIGTKDFVENDNNVYDQDSHGTFVLSTMGANLPGELIGTATDAEYYLLISEQVGRESRLEEDNWVVAAEYADSAGADIISSSLGYNTFDDPSQNYVYEDMNGNKARITIAADIAVSKGMIVVSSAGNEGNSSWQYIIPPADGDSVLSVGAVNSSGNYVSFSSVGPTADGRIKPDIVAQGSGTTLASMSGGAGSGNGTSFAAPIVSGMIACLWQANPNKKNMEIVEAVKQSASSHQSPNNTIGYGIPNFCIANELLKGKSPSFFQQDNLTLFSSGQFTKAIAGVFYSAETQLLNFRLLDISGKTVAEFEQKMIGNNYSDFEIPRLDFLGSGIYVLVISGEKKRYYYKTMKL